MKQLFTTGQYDPNDRLIAWADQVRESCVPMVFTTRAEQGFDGELCSVDNDGVCVSRISAVDHIATHDRDALRRTSDDYVLVSIQVRGNGAIEQDDRTASVGPSDMVVFDSSRPFVWHFSGEQYTVRFPKSVLSRLAPCSPQHTAVSIPAATGIRRIAADHVVSLHRALLDEGSLNTGGGKMADLTANLVSMALSDYFNSTSTIYSNVKAMHLIRARRFLSDHIHDSDLAPDRIAAELGVSSRYLYRLFSEAGESIGETILEQRLDGCANWLRQSAYMHRSITDIAMAWGFNSAEHFSRSFRRKFGMSARSFRASSGGPTANKGV